MSLIKTGDIGTALYIGSALFCNFDFDSQN